MNNTSGGMQDPQTPPQSATSAPLDVRRWSSSQQEEASRQERRWGFLEGLPTVNQVLLAGGAGLLAIGMLGIVGPPTASGVATVMHPYTAEGKQETCLAHLQSLGQAVAMYQNDYDGRFPPLDYGNGTSRQTWVSLLQGNGNSAELVCPAANGVADTRTQSSYGLNPVLAGQSKEHLQEPASVLLLADRGEAHDVSLLPPFPSWPVTQAANSATSADATNAANLDFRHSSRAAVLYADGHAGAQGAGGWVQETSSWGGRAVFTRARERLLTQHPVLQLVAAALEGGGGKAGSEVAARKLLISKRKAAEAGLSEVLALWKRNADATEQERSADVEKWGWRLAGLWAEIGQEEMKTELNRGQSGRSQAVLNAVQSGSWEKHESELGFSIEQPQGWTVESETDGRYRRTYFRPDSPHISVLVEKGERSTAGPESGIQWDGMEREFRKMLGNRYKRIRMGEATLGGEEASLWEFEIERKGEPKLRKLYLGRSHTWDSFVLVCTAPAADFKGYLPLFARVVQGFTFE